MTPRSTDYQARKDRVLTVVVGQYINNVTPISSQLLVKKYFSDTEKKGDSVFVLEGEKVPGDLFLKHKKHVSTVIIVIFSAWLLFFSFLQMKKVAKNISLKYNSYVVKKEETRNKAKEKSLASKETPKVKTKDTKKKEGFELEVSAQLATWIEVISDGELLFRGILERKQKDTWRAKKEIKLQLGNAGGVKMKFNEKDLAFSGRKGEKRTLVITKDGIKK